MSLTLGLVGAVLSGVSCRSDETMGPTAPIELETALISGATQTLAFYQVSGGRWHTCGITTANRAYCWGSGYLGDGPTSQSTTPVAVSGGHLFRQISAGDNHTCAVTTDFRAYCWGLGEDGALGNGTTTERPTPTPVAGGRLFRLVDVGNAHTCGVTYPDNQAYCWGVNDRGVLGDGTGSKRLEPVAVKGGLQWRQVSAGMNHTCGVTTSDRAYCWGSDSVGQVGDSLEARASVLTPTRVAGARRYRQVDAGVGFTCAVTTSDRAYCWGSGRSGQIGDGKTFLRYWPREVAGGHFFSRVSTGGTHACAETTGNRAYCWGSNSFGQLGDGTTTRRLSPVAVAGGRFFSQVSAGDNHTCGRTAAAVAYCWGANGQGQLGDGTKTDRRTPVAVAGPM